MYIRKYEYFSGWRETKKDVEKMLACGEWNGQKVNYINETVFD